MLKLRLSMGGTKKRPVYKIVVADSKFSRDGRFIEKLGFFNPLLPKEKKRRIGLQTDRIKYWLAKEHNQQQVLQELLGEHEIVPMPAKGNNPNESYSKKDRKKEDKEEAPKAEEKKLMHQRKLQRQRRKKLMHQRKLQRQRRKKLMHQRKLQRQRRKKLMHQRKLQRQRRKKLMHQRKLQRQRRKNKNVYSSNIYLISRVLSWTF